MNNKLKLTAILVVGSLGVSTSAMAENVVPKRPEICNNQMKEKTKNFIKKQEDSCESKVVTQNRGEESPYRSRNPDASCDLGLSFPSIPGFNFSLGDLNSCELLQAVTKDVVSEVNTAAQDVVDNATDDLMDDLGELNGELDPNDYIENEILGD